MIFSLSGCEKNVLLQHGSTIPRTLEHIDTHVKSRRPLYASDHDGSEDSINK